MPACSARDVGLIPGSGRSPGEENGNPLTPVLLPGKSHGQRSLVGYSPLGRKELDTTDRATSVLLLHAPLGCGSFSNFFFIILRVWRNTPHIYYIMLYYRLLLTLAYGLLGGRPQRLIAVFITSHQGNMLYDLMLVLITWLR